MNDRTYLKQTLKHLKTETLIFDSVSPYTQEDGEMRVTRRGRKFYGFNDKWDWTATSQTEAVEKLLKWGYTKLMGVE